MSSLNQSLSSQNDLEKSQFSYLELLHANAIQVANQSTENTLNTSQKSNEAEKEKLCEEEDEEDDGMLMDQLGQDYLFRNSAIRRHTIGTNIDKNRDADIGKN